MRAPNNYNSHRNRLYDIKARKKKYKVKKNYSMQMSVMKQNNARFNERERMTYINRQNKHLFSRLIGISQGKQNPYSYKNLKKYVCKSNYTLHQIARNHELIRIEQANQSLAKRLINVRANSNLNRDEMNKHQQQYRMSRVHMQKYDFIPRNVVRRQSLNIRLNPLKNQSKQFASADQMGMEVGYEQEQGDPGQGDGEKQNNEENTKQEQAKEPEKEAENKPAEKEATPEEQG